MNNSKNDDCLNIIRGKIKGRYTTILIDTGSNKSAIDSKLVRNLNIQIIPAGYNDPKELYAAGGQIMSSRGIVHDYIEIGGRTFKQRFIVLDNLSANIICGMDFLQTFGAVVNLCTGTLIMDEVTSIPLIRSREYLGLARLGTNVTILPGTSQSVPVRIADRKYHGAIKLMCLTDPIRGIKLVTESCTEGNRMRVVPRNETKRSIHLRWNRPIANCIQNLQDSKQATRIQSEEPMISHGRKLIETLFEIRYSPVANRNSPFYFSHSPFVIRYSLFAIRYSLFAIRYSLIIIRYSIFSIRYSLFAILLTETETET